MELSVQKWVDIAGLESNPETIYTQIKCFAEEYQEFEDAVKAKDKVEMLDGLCDMLFVRKVLGCLDAHTWITSKCNTDISRAEQICIQKFGITYENIQKGFEEVLKSNMSKFTHSAEIAEDSVDTYEDLGVTTSIRIAEHGMYTIYVVKDCQVGDKFYPEGKILKVNTFVKPRLDKFV